MEDDSAAVLNLIRTNSLEVPCAACTDVALVPLIYSQHRPRLDCARPICMDAWVCVCACVCMCVSIYVCGRVCVVCIHGWVCVHMCVYMCVNIHVCVWAYMCCKYIQYMFVCVWERACVHACVSL